MTFHGEPLTWDLSPIEALKRWPTDQPVMMLHSGRPDPRWSRYSILTRPIAAYRFTLDHHGRGQSQWLGDPAHNLKPTDNWSHHPIRDLQEVLQDPEPLWVGHLGYDIGQYIEKLPRNAQNDRAWPIVQMHRCPGWLVHDNQTGTWSACGTWGRDHNAHVQHVSASDSAPDLPNMPVNPRRLHAQPPVPHISRQAHERAIAKALDYISAGDVFQVNLTQRFTAKIQGDPRALYDTLAQTSPAWYGAYLELLPGPAQSEMAKLDTEIDAPFTAEPRRAIACTSPELFFSLDAHRNVVTRPIKGTRPADTDPCGLLDSAKDAAELTMIVDLLRNDLGRVCAYGSVRVPEPRAIESHPTVHHTTATVTGTLHPSKSLIDLIRALMPGGSITGTPKVRAMQIIDELEPVRRGPYTGAIGYIHGDTACFNIAIRTMLIETDHNADGRVDYAVGGGIVADSTPKGEYQESLDKAAAMITALNACQPHQPVHAG